ncbi:hypothetical protein VNO80_26986 [Phaseolus coccineus]|uniref:Uncharacterized protein n=1 Tax=Phaseolus coccineus TaxID=3886 RepID=A0AAN9QH66_PHACN
MIIRSKDGFVPRLDQASTSVPHSNVNMRGHHVKGVGGAMVKVAKSSARIKELEYQVQDLSKQKLDVEETLSSTKKKMESLDVDRFALDGAKGY